MGKIIVTIFILLLCACNTANPAQEVQTRLFSLLSKNDIVLNYPQEGTWRYTHDEPVESLEQYKKSTPTRVSGGKNVIYLQPFGKFSFAGQKVLTYTVEYLSIFYQLPVKLMPPVNDKLVPDSARRLRTDGSEQLLAPYFINHLLKKDLPADAVVLMAVTEKDLYPQNDWNFVFGLASYHERTGVCSINRLYSGKNDTAGFELCLTRMLNITSHEIGHMFGLPHCVTNWCVMNGSNSLAETDVQPNRLCSKCLEKLSWNFGFNNTKRLLQLQNFFQAHGPSRDSLLAKEDYDTIK